MLLSALVFSLLINIGDFGFREGQKKIQFSQRLLTSSPFEEQPFSSSKGDDYEIFKPIIVYQEQSAGWPVLFSYPEAWVSSLKDRLRVLDTP